MSNVVVLVLGAADPARLPEIEAAQVLHVPEPSDLKRHADLLASASAVVAVSDGIDGSEAPDWAAALRELPVPLLEYRSGPWDGEDPAPVAAVGRGLVAGFGLEALQRLVPLLARRSR